jgi:hypothetical protein
MNPRRRRGKFEGFAVLAAAAAAMVCCPSAIAEQLQKARVTQVVNDVKILPNRAAARPAAINDEVKQGTAIRTGTESRSELTFTDLTVSRLGANTVFTFKPGTRELKITNGAVLIQIPPGAPEAKVTTAAVSAAISGGTAIFDGPTGKFMILEGIGRFWRTGHPNNSTTVHAGEMVWLNKNGGIRRPETFNVKRLMQTSKLVTGFPPLANVDLIEQVIKQQEGAEWTEPPDKLGFDILSQKYAIPLVIEEVVGPSEFGSPPTILSPNPYSIRSDTVITTDPIVTTSGVSDRGTVYRGPSVDGSFSMWAFGSTSPFDQSSGFNAQMDHRTAALKFQSLDLSGDPTVQIVNGKTSLALLAVDGITSGEAEGVFTFSGLEELILATQSGPITLGSDISFNVPDLTMYARGAGSDLTLGSDITAMRLRLYGEHDIVINSTIHAPAIQMIAGQDIVLGQFVSDETVTGDGSVRLEAGNNIGATDQIVINRTAASASANVDITLGAAGDLTIGSGFLGNGLTLSIDNSGNNLASGAAITASAGGNLIVNGAPGFSAMINNSGTSSLGGNATIDVSAFSIATAADFNTTIKNQNGGVIHGDAAISIAAPQGIFAGGNAVVQVLNSGSPGGQITGNASIELAGANLVTNNLLVEIDSSGGAIGSTAKIDSNVAEVFTSGDATIQVVTASSSAGHTINLNGSTYDVGGTFRTAMTGGDGIITLNIASLHANTVKVGCLGANGVLNIGAGTISADTLLKLYAGGSNGTINFNSSVTLNGNSVKIIAANTINIFDGVVLTINGPVPASIYTNNPNYAVASGGNGVHGGIITGTAGANNPQPFANAPGFDDTSSSSSSLSGTTVASKSSRPSRRGRLAGKRKERHGIRTMAKVNRPNDRRRPAVRVANTDQLQDLIENGIPTGGGKGRKKLANSNDQSRRDRDQAPGQRSSGESTLVVRRNINPAPLRAN